MRVGKPEEGELRCPWCLGDRDYMRYHDREWGRPQRDSARLFEALVLDGAQAGLSWLTILKRREGYRAAFDGMNPLVIAGYGGRDAARLMADSRIIRNRRKIDSAIGNARAFCRMKDEGVNFSKWLWGFVDGTPVVNHWRRVEDIPAFTPLAETISKELKRRGFTFVGPTIVYAFMQAEGLVNDHLVTCPFRRA
ncbi:MAG: DNA-3-methyladenine glycosylase I [Treponematales bacterium]